MTPADNTLTIGSQWLGRSGLGKQATLVVVGDAITFASNFAASIFLARVIPFNDMGTYRQIVYLGPLAVAAAELGLSSTVYRFWNAFHEADRRVYLKMVVTLAFGLGLVASGCLAALAPLLARWFHNPALASALLITALFPLATLPLGLLRPVLLSQGYSLPATLLETAFSLTSILGLIVPFWLGASLLWALGIWIICLLARLAVVPLVLGKQLSERGPWWNSDVLRQVWRYLWPIQVSRIPGQFLEYFHKVVMSLFLTTNAFAVYSLGARELPFIGGIGPSVASVLIPSLVLDVQAGRLDQVCRKWRMACERTAIATYLIAAFCVWHAVPVVQFLFSATYTESSVPFRVFTILTFLRVIEYASLAKAFGRSEFIMKSAFLSAGILVCLSFPLTGRFGVMGMALAILLGTVGSSTYYLVHYKRLLGVPLADFFPWPRLLLLSGIAFGSTGLAVWAVGAMLDLAADVSMFALGWKLAALFALSGTFYALALLGLGFVKLDLTHIRQINRVQWPKKSSW